MSFASDVTDKRQLGSQCYSEIRQTTYEQRLRLQRTRLATALQSIYVVDQLLVSSPGSGYKVGAYVRLNGVGTPPLLIQVKSLTGGGGIATFAIVNKPNIANEPMGDIGTTDISTVPSGSGAVFFVSVKPSSDICCSCIRSNYWDIEPRATTFTIESISIANAGVGHYKGQILQLQYGDSPITISVDKITWTGGIAAFSILTMDRAVSQLPVNPVKPLVGTAEFTVVVKSV